MYNNKRPKSPKPISNISRFDKRDFLIVNGNILTKKEIRQQIKLDAEAKRPKINRMMDCPERTAPLLFAHKFPKSPPSRSRNATYSKFLDEGPRVTDGSYVPTVREAASSRGSRLWLPHFTRESMTRELQK